MRSAPDQRILNGGFCDGVDSCYVRATNIVVGDSGHIGVPILQLFMLED